MSGPEVITLGCRLNLAESAMLARRHAGEDDLIIVNSCAVTNEAVRQTRQAIRRAKRARPDARVVVTGCAAEVEPDTFLAMPEVSKVFGNGLKALPRDGEGWVGVLGVSEYTPSPSPLTPTIATAGQSPGLSLHSPPQSPQGRGSILTATDRARAFVGVQTGCDHRCTFCIIPYGRGPSRSAPAGLVIDRVKALVEQGFREVVLTGVDVTSYGPDLPGTQSLGQLVERILTHVPGLPRLRLSSLDCIEVDDRLFEIAAGEPRFMPHLHMSFQAGDDMILKRMKRRHSRAEAAAIVQRLKAARPDIAIGADLIAGFPTETEAMFTNTLALVPDCDIVMGHIFPYSPKQGTPAARMPQVDPRTVKDRARRLREAAARQKAAWLKGLVGTTQRVLVELDGQNGHAENFAPVRLETKAPPLNGEGLGWGGVSGNAPLLDERHPHPTLPHQGGGLYDGRIIPVRINATTDTHLIGVPL